MIMKKTITILLSVFFLAAFSVNARWIRIKAINKKA